MAQCTWEGCTKEASEDLKTTSEKIWAQLCKEHAKEVDDAICAQPFNAPRMVSVWIRAHGGAKRAAAYTLNSGV